MRWGEGECRAWKVDECNQTLDKHVESLALPHSVPSEMDAARVAPENSPPQRARGAPDGRRP
eukprot:2908464-Pyramimonas_sp.AAC.1